MCKAKRRTPRIFHLQWPVGPPTFIGILCKFNFQFWASCWSTAISPNAAVVFLAKGSDGHPYENHCKLGPWHKIPTCWDWQRDNQTYPYWLSYWLHSGLRQKNGKFHEFFRMCGPRVFAQIGLAGLGPCFNPVDTGFLRILLYHPSFHSPLDHLFWFTPLSSPSGPKLLKILFSFVLYLIFETS